MSSGSEEEELQLQNDEGKLVKRKRARNNGAATTLEAINWARDFSTRSAAKKFKVDPKCIRRWKEQENELNRQV